MNDPNPFRGTRRIYGELGWLLRRKVHEEPIGTHVIGSTQYVAAPTSKNRWRREPDGRWSVEREFTT